LGFFFVTPAELFSSTFVTGRAKTKHGLIHQFLGGRMIAGPLVALLALVGVVAIIVWLVQWASGYKRSRTALDILNERFARGEIDRDEYEEKRNLIGSR
jgi:putative membrane protein